MLLNSLYFRIRPILPRPIRIGIRRMLAVRKLERFRDSWPILPGSERPPEGWPGWPEGRQFAFVLTHDVESQRGLDRVKDLAKLEMRYGFRSSFNFVPEGLYTVPCDLRAWLVDNGFEVGVHDLHHDGRLFASRESFRENADKINHYLSEWNAAGFRSAFMLRRLDWFHDLDIQYDSSAFDTDPFEPEPEGANTIFPFWVPRPSIAETINHQPLANNYSHPLNLQPATLNHPRRGYVELPYTLPQDSTLFLLLREKTNDVWTKKLAWIACHGGMALVNVHPDYVEFKKNGRRKSLLPLPLYESFLAYVSSKYRHCFWNPIPRQLAATCSPAAGEDLSRQTQSQLSSEHAGLVRKRAAVVLYSYYPSDPRPRRAAESMIQAGMSVDLFCLRETEREPRDETINGVKVQRLPMKRKRGNKTTYVLQYSRFLVTCGLLLGRRTSAGKYDVVHVHNMPDFLVFAGLIPKLFGAKIILDLHDPMPELMQSIYCLPRNHWGVRTLRTLERWSIRFADMILTPNITFRDLFVSRNCPPTKIHIVMNSPEAKLFDPARYLATTNSVSSRNGSFNLMFHGLIAERHGLDTAITAVSNLRGRIPGLKFHIYGSRTAYMDQMIELIRELHLEETVRYHGPKTQLEIAKALASVDLGVIPNRRSPFTEINMPTRIFENLAMGKPVIAPNTKGIRDYFNDQQIIFFDPGSSDSLAQAIYWVYSHAEDAQRLVENGRRVLHVHTWQLERQNLLERVGSLLNA